MSKLLQLRGGTTTEHASFTGAVREVTVDTTKDTLVVHDGSTAGGFPLSTASDVAASLATLVDSAPATLNTLNELAAALGDDANYATTTTAAIGLKAPIASPTFTGNIGMPNGSIDLAHMSSESVDEDNLHISNAGSNGQYLQKQSGAAGGLTWGTVDISTLAPIASPSFTGNVGLGTSSPNLGGFQSGSRVMSIEGDAADDFGVLEFINPNATGSNRIGELRFINKDAGSSAVGQAGIRAFRDGADNSTAMSMYTSAAGTFAERLRVTASGNLGVGNASPSEKLHVTGNILASGNVTAYSDERLKSHIQTIPNALDKVLSVRGVTYDMNDERGTGVIAQELEKVLPEAVFDNKDGMKSVAYGNVVGMLIEAIKEQQAQIDNLMELVGG